MRRALPALVLAAALAASGSLAQSDATDVRQTIEVKKAEHDEREHDSLRFLRGNREFFRAQFDRLRLEIGYERDGQAEALDERLLGLDRMSADIAAARDTIQVELARSLGQELLMSVEELAALEAQLDLFDQLLVDQQDRLLQLERNYLAAQRTALVVVVRGLPSTGAPTALLLQEDDTTLRVPLDATGIDALGRGGIAQIQHEYVEPRAHRMSLRLEGAGFEAAAPTWLEIETPRDQLTFLELDLSGLDPADPQGTASARVWQHGQ